MRLLCKKINLSIQIPHDTKSMLPMHSDIYAGESIRGCDLDTSNGCKEIYSFDVYYKPKR